MSKVKKIVIADDFVGVRTIIKESLLKRGFTVLEANNGEEALKFFDGTTVDLLITDFDMPEMDGAKLVRKLRETSKYMYTPVIMLSGVRKERLEEEISDLNIACFLQKPFEIKNFYSIIDRLV